MKKIDISTAKYPDTFALVDDGDYDYLNKHKWYPRDNTKTSTLYAIRTINGIKVRMHRFLMNLSPEVEIDHRDRNGLNNQRQNLRLCNHSQNCANRPVRKDSFSGFKGVWWDASRLRWVSKIRFDGTVKYLCRFTCITKAAKAYDRAAKARYGEFAWLNFPLLITPPADRSYPQLTMAGRYNLTDANPVITTGAAGSLLAVRI